MLITFAKIYALLMGIMSIVAICMFAVDKRRAIVNAKSDSGFNSTYAARIPEKTLLWVAIMGGWPGALLGQRWFRHKTVKLKFRMVLWLIVLLHLVLIAAWIYFWLQIDAA